MKIAEVAAVTRMSRKTRTSSRGCAVLRSRQMKAASSATVPMNPAMDSVLVQPRCGPSMIVYTSSDTNAMESKKPVMSRRSAFGSFDSGTNTACSSSATATIGTLMRNTEPHQKCSSKNPPVTGPNATAAPETADQTPIDFARSTGSRNTSMRIASVLGNTRAAPIPISPRPMMSCSVVSVNAAHAENTPKRNMPICITILRPKRSPRPPQASSRPANTRAYESTIHCKPLVVASSSRARVGIATLMMRLSTTTRNTERLRIVRIHHRRLCTAGLGCASVVAWFM